jgi:hypothetical protein
MYESRQDMMGREPQIFSGTFFLTGAFYRDAEYLKPYLSHVLIFRYSEPDSRMFYKADEVSLGRNSRDATELVPISGDIIKSLGRSLHFTCNALEQGR